MRRERRFLQNKERYRAAQARKRAAKRKRNNTNLPLHDTADNSSSLRRGEQGATAGFLSSGK
jgi:hypothetical protein